MTVRPGKITLSSDQLTDRLGPYWREYPTRRLQGGDFLRSGVPVRTVTAAPMDYSSGWLDWLESLRGLSLVAILGVSAWGEWQAIRWITWMAMSDIL